MTYDEAVECLVDMSEKYDFTKEENDAIDIALESIAGSIYLSKEAQKFDKNEEVWRTHE